MPRVITSSKRTALKLSASILLLATIGVTTPISSADDVLTSESSVAPAAVIAPDYAAMSTFMLANAVSERGRTNIRYKKLRKDSPAFFDEYEAYLVGIDVAALTPDDQLAYWLNLQNFLAVKAVTLDTKKTSLKSLRGSGSKPGKLWTKERVTVGGQAYSLADIDNKLVTGFDDPNVLYGIYQGVKGAPCLSETPFDGASVHERLSELAKIYVNARGIVSPEKGVANVTPIYDWYNADLFGDDDKALLSHLKTNSETRLRGRLNTVRKINYTKLNYELDVFTPQQRAKAGDRPRKRSGSSAPRPTSSGSGGGGGGSYGS